MSSKLGVIVPAYNEELHISRCLDSLITQTAATFLDFEIIVVDDGSTDSTSRILESYAEKYPDLMTIITQENQGRGAARNRGLTHALSCCDYIGFVDADDWVSPILYESLYDAIKDKGDAAIALCDYEATDKTGAMLFRYYEGTANDFYHSFLDNKRQMQFFGASLCNKLFSAETLRFITFPRGIDFEDLACTFCAGLYANEIVKVDLSLYHYYQDSPGSVMSAVDERYLDIFAAVEYWLDDFEKRDALEPLKAQVTYIAALHLLRGRMRDLLKSTRNKSLADTYLDRAYELLDRRLPDWRTDLKKNQIFKSGITRVMSSRKLMNVYMFFARKFVS